MESPRSKLKGRGGLELAGGPCPRVEEIASPAVRRVQHRLVALPVRVAVKPRVVQCHTEQRTGRKGVGVREAHGSAFPVVVGRGGLRNQRGDVGELRSLRKYVQRYSYDLLWRKDRLKRAVGIESLLLDFVAGPGQATHGITDNVVFEDFGKTDFVSEHRPAKDDARRGAPNADKVVIFAAQADIEVAHAELPTFRWRHGFHDREPAGEAAIFSTVWSLDYASRLHCIERNGNRKRTRDRVGHFRVIHLEHGLILGCAAEIQFSIRRTDHTGGQRQGRLEVFFGKRESGKLFFAEL